MREALVRVAAGALLVLAAGARAVAAMEGPAVAAPSEHACAQAPQVVVQAALAADALMACQGASRALGFLARAGMALPDRTTITIVQQLPGDLQGRAVGCYLRESRSIQLLSFESFQAGGAWFRMPADRELYTAAAAHEVAHATVGCQSQALSRPLPVAAHEYVAYVVLFATLDPPLRERLLARFPGRGFENTLQINDLNHIANPNQFGVDAWRHYLRRPRPEAWLREVVSGQIVQDVFGDGP